jgi:hypothetical protein
MCQHGGTLRFHLVLQELWIAVWTDDDRRRAGLEMNPVVEGARRGEARGFREQVREFREKQLHQVMDGGGGEARCRR